MRTKRILSLVMALSMLFTLTAPTFAWALEDDGNVETYKVTITVSPSRAKAKVTVYAQRDDGNYADAEGTAYESGLKLQPGAYHYIATGTAHNYGVAEGDFVVADKAVKIKVTLPKAAAQAQTPLVAEAPQTEPVLTEAEAPVQENIPATCHTPVTDAAVAPTCTETGLTEGSHCSVCNAVLTAQETVPATGHTAGAAVRENEVEATCTVAGSYDEVVYCSVCHAELSRTAQPIPALGHDLVHHDAQAATCTAIGWAAYDTCSRCDYTTYVEIPALTVGYTDSADGLTAEIPAGYFTDKEVTISNDNATVTFNADAARALPTPAP